VLASAVRKKKNKMVKKKK